MTLRVCVWGGGGVKGYLLCSKLEMLEMSVESPRVDEAR